MARITGRNTSPERILRRALWASGLRYRLHARTSAGRPDLVLRQSRVVVYADGCQWHGCPRHYVSPRTARQFWSTKLEQNVARDRRQTLMLEQDGWRVVRVWEHEVHEDLPSVVSRVIAATRAATYPSTQDLRVIRVRPVLSEGDWEERLLADLRDPDDVRLEVVQRSTKKWTRRSRGGL